LFDRLSETGFAAPPLFPLIKTDKEKRKCYAQYDEVVLNKIPFVINSGLLLLLFLCCLTAASISAT